MKQWIIGALLLCGWVSGARAAESGEAVLVIYNSAMPASKGVAEHYAQVRHVPANQVLGLALPEGETMSRADYETRLRKPALAHIEKNKLLTFAPGAGPSDAKGTNTWRVLSASIRYIALCYGVPIRIAEDPALDEPGKTNLPEALRFNTAAVDSEMAVMQWRNLPLTGPLANYTFGLTNGALISPVSNILMVARLDGPTPAIARALVDKAVEAETNGLWGRGYFDARGFTNTDLLAGDAMIRRAEQITRMYGFDTYIDENPATMSAEVPFSQVAFYAGWYDQNVSGPLAQPKVEFMPGAFAYHLHSYSAVTLRSTNTYWAGPLLAAGATATIGYVNEPLLGFTADMGMFFERFLMGRMSFGEAAYASQRGVSWQTTVIGDPLYRPFGKLPQDLHAELIARKSPLLQWSHLRVVNLNLVTDLPAVQAIDYIQSLKATPSSAVLNEKLGDIFQSIGKPDSAIKATETALALNPSPQQRIRLTFTLAQRLADAKKEERAFQVLDDFYRETPAYVGRLSLARRLEELAGKLNKSADAKRYSDEVKRLSAPGAK